MSERTYFCPLFFIVIGFFALMSCELLVRVVVNKLDLTLLLLTSRITFVGENQALIECLFCPKNNFQKYYKSRLVIFQD